MSELIELVDWISSVALAVIGPVVGTGLVAWSASWLALLRFRFS